MQDPPDKEVFLEAVATFLEKEVRGAVKDPALVFRVLIAAHLLRVVEGESRKEDLHDSAEAQRLAEVLDLPDPPSSRMERREFLAHHTASLALSIRSGALSASPDSPAWQHIKATLREKLQVIQPRFDLSSDI